MIIENSVVSEHIPVLLNEVIASLVPKKGGIYFDGTFGGGGYSRAILEYADCKVIACDRDIFVQNIARDFYKLYPNRFVFSHEKFSNISSIIEFHKNFLLSDYHSDNWRSNLCIDGVVLDLGISNFQITNQQRGFSFRLEGPLDMSMGLCEENALEVIRKYSEKQLADIIYIFGEETFAKVIAKNIKMNLASISTTGDLANIVRKCVKKIGKTDPATKTFQALRIFVNDELGELEKVLRESVKLLNYGGKIIVVSFHSLEDRIVKQFFKNLISENQGKFQLINKKPIIPSEDEVIANPKSRSAKLRGISML